MNARRGFLRNSLANLALLALPSARASASTAATRTIYQHDLPNVSLSGWQVTILELTFPPGETSPKHMHPGFVLGYVLEGKFRFHVEGEKETVLGPGDVFCEPPGRAHLPSGSASAALPARVLALVFSEKGKELVMPA